MKTPDYELLMYKSLNGAISDDEQKMLTAWLEERTEHQRSFDELRQILDMVDASEEVPPFTEEQVQRQRELLGQSLAVAKRAEVAQYRSSLRWRNAAIAALLVVSCGLGALYFLQHPGGNEAVSIETGAEQKMILPDHSVVTLNQDSKLTFSQNTQQRSVTFRGEAFFQVAENKEVPFVIELPIGFIKVLGTSFFVRAYAADSAEVVVVTGKVEVSSDEGKVILKQNDKVTVARGRVPRVTDARTDPNFNSWYTHRLHFEKAALGHVLTSLEKRYHATFKVTQPALLGCRFTGTFENEDLNTILAVLSTSTGFSFHLQDNVYLVTGTGCNH